MQSQKLPLWQLFLFSCAKQRYLPPSRQPGHSAHIHSGIHGTLRSRHTAPVPGNSAHAGPHGTAYGQSSRHPRTRLKTQGTRYARRTWFPNTPCTTKPPASLRTASVFPRRASPRGTTLPGDPLILRRPHSFPENPDPSPESLLFGKPLGLEADIRAVGRHQVCPRRLGRYVADDIDAPHAHHLLL